MTSSSGPPGETIAGRGIGEGVRPAALWPSRAHWSARIASYVDGVPTVVPRAGLLVLFPSAMLHGVRRYRGVQERVVLSFNLR